MIENVFLIGSGQTRFSEHWDRSLRDLADESITKAIEDSPCTALDIDAVIVANMLAGSTENQMHLGAHISSLLPHKPPALRVEAACASGAIAVHTACALLESRKAETVLVVGAEKMTDVDGDTIAHALMSAADNEEDQLSELTFPGIFGLIAHRYMYEHELSREQLNMVSTRAHKNATQNPYAQFRREIAPETVSQSPCIADPLHMLDCSPISDGASACILSRTFDSDIRICASQVSTDTLSITKRPSLTSFGATISAMKHALKEAEIDREEISHIEMHDCFSIAAIINMEDLGFAKRGEGINFFAHRSSDSKIAAYQIPRFSNRDYEHITINHSGGLKACGHPVAATGVKQIADVAKQLKSSQSRYGLTHNFGGAGATCGIHILERLAVSG